MTINEFIKRLHIHLESEKESGRDAGDDQVKIEKIGNNPLHDFGIFQRMLCDEKDTCILLLSY